MSDDDFEGHARWRPTIETAADLAEAEGRPQGEDAINPGHYKPRGLPEVIDQMVALYGKGVVAGYCLCAAFKYRSRAGLKPGQPVEQDIGKARWHEQMREHLLGRGPDPRSGA